MSDFIGQVMGGYLDENNKLMVRSELNKRISLKDEKISKLEKEVERLQLVVDLQNNIPRLDKKIKKRVKDIDAR